jgi:hypothetical protein
MLLPIASPGRTRRCATGTRASSPANSLKAARGKDEQKNFAQEVGLNRPCNYTSNHGSGEVVCPRRHRTTQGRQRLTDGWHQPAFPSRPRQHSDCFPISDGTQLIDVAGPWEIFDGVVKPGTTNEAASQ